MNKFLAKSNPEETIQEHTNNLILNYDLLQSLYPNIKYLNWDILKLACLYHDLGKINTKFQNKLMKKMSYDLLKDNLESLDEINHNFLSPAYLPKKKLSKKYNEEELKILYQSIYRHHKRGLPNSGDLIKTIKEDLQIYIDKFNTNGYELLKDIDLSEGLNFKYIKEIKENIVPKKDGIKTFYNYVITKGLLNKIDYAASSYVDNKDLKVEVENKDLKEKVDDFFNRNKYKKNELQNYMEEKKDENNVIVASTGIGKTEAALLWIGNNKGFFTLPLRVSINAIFDRIKDGGKEGINFKDTGLLHSDTYSEYLKRTDNESFNDYYFYQTKQMSLPLTICTLDQLIDFIFRYEGFEIKLATLSYSRLVIDEIQAYSPEYIAYLICALKFITDVGGKFSIITATFPPIIEYFMNKEKIPYKRGPEFLKNQSRHNLNIIEENINLDKILKQYKHKKMLIICNTVKRAQEIYQSIKDEIDNNTNINLLHSRFIRKDRKKLEDNIIEIGNKNSLETGIWVTTQVVEASLDIDFDELHTELSDLTGLFQRMGRVYRNRELKESQDFNVYVYTGIDDEIPSGISETKNSLVDINIFKYSKEELLKQGNRIYDEYLKMEMVRSVYTVEKLKDDNNDNYYNKIERTIKYVMNIEEYFFEKGQQQLRDIKSETIIPIEVYDVSKNIIDDCIVKISNLKGKENKSLREVEKDKIKEYFVDIPYYMLEGKDYEFLDIDKYNKVKILYIEYQYDLGIINNKVKRKEKSNDDNFF